MCKEIFVEKSDWGINIWYLKFQKCDFLGKIVLLENDIEIIQNVGFVNFKKICGRMISRLYKFEMNIKDNMKTKIVYSYYKYQKKENDLF